MDRKRSSALLLVFFAVIVVVSSGRGQSSSGSSVRSDPQNRAPESSALLHEPLGASRCQFCHAAEVEGYARSAMAHSLRRAGQEPDGTVQTADARITMHSSQSGYWQSLESGGAITNYRIDYVIGSGNHAAGYLLDVAGHLFQSPVAYYKSRQAYDLAPGFEGLPNPDFTRPIAEACLFCHSGDALKISDTANRYRSPPFSAEAITCERCHGSAEKHLSDPRAGTIVNPAKLEPAARDSICEQCHLLGVGRVLNPGKKFSDFRPGEPMEDVFTTYCNVSPPGAANAKFKVISHVEQLARSTCSRMSNGKLWCGTCHDPHDKPAEPAAFFRSKCLSCHTQNFAASHPDKQSNCIGCHMPRREAKDGGHTAFTDHRIQRRPEPEEALPPDIDIRAWRDPASDLQKRNLGIAYINVGLERRSPPFIGRGYRMLTEVQQQFAADDGIFTAMGAALLIARQTSEAELAFERALQLNPDSVSGETNAASAYLQAGDQRSAIAHLERAITLDPLHLAADVPLIELYKQQGESAKAAELSSRISAAMGSNGTMGLTGTMDSNGMIGSDRRTSPDRTAEQPLAASDRDQKAAANGAVPAAEAVFKNIQVLKGTPSDQLIPAMRFIAASLGVDCSHCHVQDHFEKDDKKPKQIARDMMRMMFTINQGSFAGNREVTCYSCHRGSIRPEGTPLLASETGPPRSAAPLSEKTITNLPTADEVIDSYIRALGGSPAIDKVTSRVATGTTTVGGKSFGVEIFVQEPGRLAAVRHTPAGDSVTVFNGRQGWSSVPGHMMREIHGADLEAAQADADLHFPLNLKQACAELRTEYPENVGRREAYVISCVRPGKTPVKFFFDEQSGLLVRVLRYSQSPLGSIPAQIDYGDYRDAGGVKMPFRWVVAQPDGTTTTQLQQVEENVPIDGARFSGPASAVPSR